MTRDAIEALLRMQEIAFRADPWGALLRNLESVRPEEWDIRPETWSEDEFGPEPELSIADIVRHVATAKFMYANRAFGNGTRQWEEITAPAGDPATLAAWLEEGQRELSEGLSSLSDDRELAVERTNHRDVSRPREWFVTTMISHDLYHAGEINRQRALIRGARGWTAS